MPITRGNGMNDDPVGEIPPAHVTESEEEDESPPIEEDVPEEQDEESMAGSDPTDNYLIYHILSLLCILSILYTSYIKLTDSTYVSLLCISIRTTVQCHDNHIVVSRRV